MGGFGAYELALEHPGAFCAVGGYSPALWLRGVDTAPGAFGPIPIWNDYGSEDPFAISNLALDETLETAGADVSAHSWAGEHARSYWDRHWRAYLRFYANALRDCAE